MSIRQEARDAVQQVAGSTYYVRWLYAADAASNVWEPKVERLKALLRMFHSEAVCSAGPKACDVCEALQDG